jgi:outer membrane lipoprotein
MLSRLFTLDMNHPLARSAVLVVLAASLGACATVPAPLQGQFAPVTPKEALATAAQTPVRWGGEIISVDPKAGHTCFEILGRELDSTARPVAHDPSLGRFLACRDGFYDPEEFKQGRYLTVVGRIDGSEQGKIGEYDYTYPRVAADIIYLWPVVPRVGRYYDSYPGGYGPWGDPFWSPGWAWWGPPVVIVHRHHGADRPKK